MNKKPNFEKDIQVLISKMENYEYAQAFYATLCNTEWKKDYSYSWRHADGLVASVRMKTI